jgi:hypothetical protein
MFCARKQNYIRNYPLQNTTADCAGSEDGLPFSYLQILPDRDIHVENYHIGFQWLCENSVFLRIPSLESE